MQIAFLLTYTKIKQYKLKHTHQANTTILQNLDIEVKVKTWVLFLDELSLGICFAETMLSEDRPTS